MEGVKVKLTRRRGRKAYVCRVLVPGAPGWVERSTGKTRKREAETAARAIVAQIINEGARELRGWSEFRARYETEGLGGKPFKTLEAFQTAANRLETLCRPEWITDVDAEMLSVFALRLREAGLSAATLQAYRAHIMAALKWAVAVELLDKRPKPPELPDPVTSRGRPLQREEIERIAMQLPGIVGEDHARAWAWNLEGLWRSGFRLGETLLFYWDPGPGRHYVENLAAERPRIRIDAAGEKAGKGRTLPMTPDFAAMLRAVPEAQRRGLVFKWPLSRGNTSNVKTIGKRISDAGKAAGVVTGTRIIRQKGKRPTDGPQYATAHDFRRSFGARWAPKVMPIVLQLLMRHESIETTQKFYVGRSADLAGDALWQNQDGAVGDMLDALFDAGAADVEIQ